MKKILQNFYLFSKLSLSITLLLILILLGYLFYRDWGQQPDLIQNPFGTTINHFIYYLYVSLLGFFVYLKSANFKKLVYWLLFLSIILELLHYIIPNRSFQLGDLIGNILGVIVAYLIIKIYLFFSKS